MLSTKPETGPSAVGFPHLVRLRWLAIPGQFLAFWILAGQIPQGWLLCFLLPFLTAASNLGARLAVHRWPTAHLAGSLILADTLLLTVWLAETGGAANPFTLLYLTLIALAALTLGPGWTWGIGALTSVAFFALLWLPLPPSHHGVANSALDAHLRGMFLAFVLAAALTAFFAAGLRHALDARDQALAAERAERSRIERLAVLSTLIGTAAHELSSPVATMALAGDEIARRLRKAPHLARELAPELEALREQAQRCRRILDGLAERAGNPRGEAPRPIPLSELMAKAVAELEPECRSHLEVRATTQLRVLVPERAVVAALAAILRNAFDASTFGARVEMIDEDRGPTCAICILDRGTGLSDEASRRAGEPFFTTKPLGQGMGLGVHMARTLLSQLQGSLTLLPREGGGTVARLEMPVLGK